MAMARSIRKHYWLRILALVLGIALILIARPVIFLIGVAISDRDQRLPLPPGIVDDQSRLNATRVAEIWDMPPDNSAEQKLRDLLARAKRDHLCVSIAGARHSMGGQTIYPNGIQINMLPYHGMTLDDKANLLDVQSGARWSEVVPFLDQHHLSIAVMQASNPFSVGGSLSVNCHGWQPGRPPIASTVESFRIMLADGTILRCSRSENPQLFSLALGGYGLFGIILDARIRVVPNERYEMNQYLMPTGQFLAAWAEHVDNSADVGMALGRLSIVPEDFLNQAELYTFTRAPLASGDLPPLKDVGLQELSRLLFRGSVDSDYGKKLRWEAETKLLTHFAGKFYSRNQLLNQPAEILANRTADSTDILQEYFIPRAGFNDFVAQMRVIIPERKGNLLNVTLREVCQDPDTQLRYADRDMIALVLLLNQRRTDTAESQMRALTQQLVDAALADGGRYYLPYRLEATSMQFEEAYPQSKQFFNFKRQYDPGELFQNELYLQYGRANAKP
jgi:FAD/FMN-containing dehydrogenase